MQFSWIPNQTMTSLSCLKLFNPSHYMKKTLKSPDLTCSDLSCAHSINLISCLLSFSSFIPSYQSPLGSWSMSVIFCPVALTWEGLLSDSTAHPLDFGLVLSFLVLLLPQPKSHSLVWCCFCSHNFLSTHTLRNYFVCHPPRQGPRALGPCLCSTTLYVSRIWEVFSKYLLNEWMSLKSLWQVLSCPCPCQDVAVA